MACLAIVRSLGSVPMDGQAVEDFSIALATPAAGSHGSWGRTNNFLVLLPREPEEKKFLQACRVPMNAPDVRDMFYHHIPIAAKQNRFASSEPTHSGAVHPAAFAVC